MLELHWGCGGDDTVFSRVYASLDELEGELLSGAGTGAPTSDDNTARSVLAHSVPGVSGAVYTFSDSSIVAYENHR